MPTIEQPPRRLRRDEQRAQTRQRLLDAAETLVAAQGLGSTSIEEIAEAAGYSRGAFYSNFADRDELVLALLERHYERSMAEVDALFGPDTEPADFLAALRTREVGQSEDHEVRGMEYLLYAIRMPEHRERVKAIHDRILEPYTAIIAEQFRRLDRELPIPADEAARVLMGLDEGFSLLRLIDPEGFPHGMWVDTVTLLTEAAVALAEKRAAEGTT